jgi:predicted transcriptional regulator
MKKNTVIETLQSFEDEFETEKLIKRLLFVEKVEKGLRDVDEGKVINYEEAKQKFFDK